ncbi:MAG: hypothetical protein Q9208_006201 [Pyrenodesmia sp. 3 TL-2023]
MVNQKIAGQEPELAMGFRYVERFLILSFKCASGDMQTCSWEAVKFFVEWQLHRCSVYMLYFDQTFHIMPTSPSTTSRFITWRNALEIFNHILDHDSKIWDQSTTSTTVLAQQLGKSNHGILKQVDADPIRYNVTNYLIELRYAGDPDGDAACSAAFKVVLVLVNAALKFLKMAAVQIATARQ